MQGCVLPHNAPHRRHAQAAQPGPGASDPGLRPARNAVFMLFLVWSGQGRAGLVWSGLVWSGLVRSRLVSSGLVCLMQTSPAGRFLTGPDDDAEAGRLLETLSLGIAFPIKDHCYYHY